MATEYRRLRKWPGPEPPPEAGPEKDAPPPGGTSGPPPAGAPPPGGTSGPPPAQDPPQAPDLEPPPTPLGIVKYGMQDNARTVRLCCIAIVLSACLFGGLALVALAIKGIHLHIPAFSIRGQSYISIAGLFFGGSGLTVFLVARGKKIIKRRGAAPNGEDQTTTR